MLLCSSLSLVDLAGFVLVVLHCVIDCLFCLRLCRLLLGCGFVV